MRGKKIIILLLVLVLSGCICLSAAAAGCADVEHEETPIVLRATGHFDIDVPAKTMRKAGTSFSMEYGETVTIKASYTPFSADVDFGLIDSSGRFYYFSATDGIADRSVKISARGQYTFAVRNNSSFPISASGYVNY